MIVHTKSISDDETIEATSLIVLVSTKSLIGPLGSCTSLDFKETAEVLEKLDLESVVFRVVLNMALVILQVLDNVLLLSELSVEEILVALEFVTESLVRCVHEFGFISNSLKEGIIDLILNVV